MAQECAHVHCDTKRNGIESVMGASAVAHSEINGLGRRKTQASTKSVVRRQTRTAYCLVALSKRRAVTSGPAKSALDKPAVVGLHSPWHPTQTTRRTPNPINNIIVDSG